jgi:hypothetical protein
MSTIEPTAGNWPSEINPYASPETWQSENTDRIEIVPRMLPRDRWDALITLGFVLLIIPSGFALMAVLRYPWQNQLVPATIFTVILLPALFALLISVRRLTIDQIGIQIHRRLGGPRYLHWEQIHTITLVSREEVLLRGYLLPPLPAKATMNTTSYLQHYRIDWEGGVLYFPPANVEQFLSAVRRWQSGCLVQE